MGQPQYRPQYVLVTAVPLVLWFGTLLQYDVGAINTTCAYTVSDLISEMVVWGSLEPKTIVLERNGREDWNIYANLISDFHTLVYPFGFLTVLRRRIRSQWRGKNYRVASKR